MSKSRGLGLIGQGTIEYAVLLALVVAAIVAMQVYLKRGIQGRIKDLADQLAPEGSLQQYEPGRAVSYSSTLQTGMTRQETVNGTSTTYQGLRPDGRPDNNSRPERVTRAGYDTSLPETQ